MSFKLLSQIESVRMIARIGKAAHMIQDRIHIVACSTLDHIRAHGDTTGALALLNALPRGQRVKSLAFWYSHFSSGKVKFKADKGIWSVNLSKDRSDSDFNITAAMDMCFSELTSEKDPVSITVESMLRNLERNATNTDTHDGTDIPKVSPEARAFASELVAFARSKKAA
jgi:hypothetical protein